MRVAAEFAVFYIIFEKIYENINKEFGDFRESFREIDEFGRFSRNFIKMYEISHFRDISKCIFVSTLVVIRKFVTPVVSGAG